jgi:drug/metabolite transporter (DMT)-like permease
MSSHRRAVLQAVFVTVLWSTSWVLIKFGLEEIPAMTFAGLRYGLAFLILAPLLARSSLRTRVKSLSRRQRWQLVALGLIMYTATQGAQFLALDLLPAQTTSLVLSFSPILVAFLSAVFLAERPLPAQFLGVGVFVIGAGTYLYPAALPASQVLGLAVALVGLVANAGAAVLGRFVNRSAGLPAAVVTIVSMGVGALGLLGVGLSTQGLPELSSTSWLIVVWLATVNTALAFTLWNASLQRLTALESSLINNTMLIQIAVLAWVFLGEGLNARQVAGIVVAASGVLVVQLTRRPSRR